MKLISKCPSLSLSLSHQPHLKSNREMLGEFSKIRVALRLNKELGKRNLTTLCLSVVLIVCVSAWNKPTVYGLFFLMKTIWISFQISAQKIQQILKSDKNNMYFTCRPMCIYDEMSVNYFYNRKIDRQFSRSVLYA